MNPKIHHLLPLLVLALLVTVLTLGLPGNRAQDGFSSPLLGQKLAEFDLPPVGSDRNFSPRLWSDKPALINVFASWCQSCAAEHKLLSKLSDRIDLYGIAWKDKPADTSLWLAKYGNPFRAVGSDQQGATTVPLALSGIPETFIVDRNGIVVFHYKSTLTQHTVDTVILPLIEKLAHAPTS